MIERRIIMKKTLILTCALAIALTSSTAIAATVTKNIKGTNVTVTKSTPKYDKAVNDYNKAKKDATKVDPAKAKAEAKAKAKADAKAKANKKINSYTNEKGVSVKIK